MQSKRILWVFIVFVMVFATYSALQPKVGSEALSKIDPNLVEQIEEAKANGIGEFTAVVKVGWNPNLAPIKFNHDAVIDELKAEAARTQEPVLTYLKQKGNVEILNTFWLSNAILIKAQEDTIKELAALSTVEKVLVNFAVTVPRGETIEIGSTSLTAATWNIQKVRAPEVWETLGITGEGVKFATTGTGVDITHQDLVGTMFTADPSDPKYPGGWVEFDVYGYPVWSTPHDTYGHGTATYGLIVGGSKGPYGAVGMAPGAKGMHALTLPGGGGYWLQVLAGLQWVIDPYDEAGNHYPMARVSSHSWGAYEYNCYLIEAIENMHQAGHFICATVGHGGEGKVGCPGNYYSVCGVGATDINDDVPYWSGGGWVYKANFACAPGWWPEKWIKPDVTAPGANVIVPYPGNKYICLNTGQSDHVAGAAVLMLSGNPTLNPDQIREALESTAVWYPRYYPSRPDTRYGWGRIDALEATTRLVTTPTQVYVDIKPASWPNPINVDSKGVFAVAICGTEDFDVMTIDPATVKIRTEEIVEGVAPIRWSYEDVATPYTGPPGGGHDLGADGRLDLVLIFDTQTVVTKLGLAGHVGETIPLTIRGNLISATGGTRITGRDYVWIL